MKSKLEDHVKNFRVENGRSPVSSELNSNDINRYAHLKLRQQTLNHLRDDVVKQKLLSLNLIVVNVAAN